MNDRGILATYLMSALSKITNPEVSSHFELVNYSSSNRFNDLLLQKTIPITLHDNLLTFRDTGKALELKRDLLKMITNKNYKVDLASLQDKKLMYDVAKELNFDVRALGNKSTRDRTLIKFLKSPGLMVSASGSSNTLFLPSAPSNLYERIIILLQEKQAGNNSSIIYKEFIAISDKLLDYKCITRKQQKHILIKTNLLFI